MKHIPPAGRWAAVPLLHADRDRPTARGGAPSARRLLQVPTSAGFPAGLVCDVVETSAEHGLRILDCLPNSGCVLTDGHQWSWIVPTGSDIDVEWPPTTRYLADAAVLVSPREPRTDGLPAAGRIRPRDHDVPYTHPILLYFAACGLAGVKPAMTVE
jgi:hypothetical protein